MHDGSLARQTLNVQFGIHVLQLKSHPKLRTSLLSRKGVLLMQMHLHWCFICVGLGWGEAVAFGVLQ